MQDILAVLESFPFVFYVLIGALSLCIGSFLNVVIHRLPSIMNQEWEYECKEFLNIPHEYPSEKISLSKPRSRCPKCKTLIKWHQNIPVLSWVLLKGKCKHCAEKISPLYPFVELLTATISVLIAIKFGVTTQTLFSLIFLWLMVPLFFIDLEHQILPDRILLPLMGFALLSNLLGTFVSIEQSVWGLIVGFMSLWTITAIFKLITGKDGMGFGDFKLLAVIGAILGVQAIISIVVISAVSGCIIGGIQYMLKKESTPYAFGNHLCIAFLVCLILYPNYPM